MITLCVIGWEMPYLSEVMTVHKTEKLAAAILQLEERLSYVSAWSDEFKHNNHKAYQDVMELSAWLCLYKYGNKEVSERAGHVIMNTL